MLRQVDTDLVARWGVEEMSSHEVHLGSFGDTGGFSATIDLENGHLAVWFDYAGEQRKYERPLLPDELSTLHALTKRAMSEEPTVVSHPQTVVGDEHIRIVDGEDTFTSEAKWGYFIGGAIKELFVWAASQRG